MYSGERNDKLKKFTVSKFISLDKDIKSLFKKKSNNIWRNEWSGKKLDTLIVRVKVSWFSKVDACRTEGG